MNFQVFGILNTISEFFAFVMMCFVVLIGTALTVAANEAGAEADASGLAPHYIYTILLLAHAICTIIMVRKKICCYLVSNQRREQDGSIV